MRRLLLVLVTAVLCLPLAAALPAAEAAPAAPAAVAQAPVAAQVAAKRGPYACWRAANATCRINGGVTFRLGQRLRRPEVGDHQPDRVHDPSDAVHRHDPDHEPGTSCPGAGSAR
ncbi:hypothetical protein G5V59_09025 [Nocardioides sp. W3-2-3]|uniref:hypothetical protein n=1 Tax=Nocardioides convexus TaxID=2712224 RepID=UPI0024185054|nr:hypothetical protein [Nocardioides convexus]NHA00228.1 hypothetical protein [Nocardioides convexus]